jgi:hypothetical protein
MKYDVRLEPSAINDVTAAPAVLQHGIIDGLMALGDHPTGPRNADINSAELGRAYEFSFKHDEMTCWVRIVYQFGQDEQALYVRRVRWEML